MARKARNHPVPRNKMLEIHEPKSEARLYSVALYIRLSKEDSGKKNQNTIQNQKALLEDYVSNNSDMKVYDFYIDNGYSGSNFVRPAFKKMMEDAKQGKINCIVVKDLSRFGRSYLEMGNYLEKIFPFFNIRFISVTDNYDTFAVTSSDNGRILSGEIEIPLKNIINDVYAKDISRKVGSALEIKKREGRYGGGVAPYGYLKSKTVKGKYEIDEEAAGIVRYIFELRAREYGYCSIVKILNLKEIKSPSAYRFEKGIVKDERLRDAIWKIYVIRDMLHDEVYLGNMVRGKTHSALHKGEKRHHVPKSEWIVVQGTHEPIISKELFNEVQAVNAKRAQEHSRKLEKAKEHHNKENLFTGKLFCGDCGISMRYSAGKNNYMNYYCPNYKQNGVKGCIKKNISAKKLEKSVFEAVRIHIQICQENKEIMQLWNKRTESGEIRKELEKEIRDLEQKKRKYQQRLNCIYFDYKDQLLTMQEYINLKKKYQTVLKELEADSNEKELFLTEMQEAYGEKIELFQTSEQYADQLILTKNMVEAFIERIEVFANGRIHIVFRFEDEYQKLIGKRSDVEQEAVRL